MGYGDDLLAAGLAEHLFAQDPAQGKVMICDRAGAPRWRPLWENNPAIGVSRPQRTVRSGKGCLPYLEYPYSAATGLRFSKTFRAADYRGHLYLTRAERKAGLRVQQVYGSFIVVGGTPADRVNLNRGWPQTSWQALVDQLHGSSPHRLVQLEYPGMCRLEGIPSVPTPTIRDACGVISAATMVIVLEGGLAFIAAALGIPAVVLWGGCISAETLAFPEHVNLVDPSPETPCGALVPCDHCVQAWARLTPQTVIDATRSEWMRATTHPLVKGA